MDYVCDVRVLVLIECSASLCASRDGLERLPCVTIGVMLGFNIFPVASVIGEAVIEVEL